MTLPTTPYNFTGGGIAYLNVAIGAGDASFTVQSGQGAQFPTSNFIVYCESECIIVTTRSTDVFSGLTRGANSTSATSHTTADMISERYTNLHNTYFSSAVIESYNSSTTDTTVSAGKSLYFSGDYEIISGVVLDILSGAVVEIG